MSGNPSRPEEVPAPSPSPLDGLVADLLEWIGEAPRPYAQVLDAWRTSCPRLTVWEDATERGLVEAVSVNGRSIVRATPAGLALLEEKRPPTHRPRAWREAD